MLVEYDEEHEEIRKEVGYVGLLCGSLLYGYLTGWWKLIGIYVSFKYTVMIVRFHTRRLVKKRLSPKSHNQELKPQARSLKAKK